MPRVQNPTNPNPTEHTISPPILIIPTKTPVAKVKPKQKQGREINSTNKSKDQLESGKEGSKKYKETLNSSPNLAKNEDRLSGRAILFSFDVILTFTDYKCNLGAFTGGLLVIH